MNGAVRSRPLHQLVLPGYPIMFLYAHNVAQGTVHSVGQTLMGSALAVVAIAAIAQGLTWVVDRVVKERQCAAALVSAMFLGFFGYGHIVNVVESVDALALTFARHRVLFPASAAVFLLAAVMLIRNRGRLGTLTVGANAASAVLLALAIWALAWWALTTAGAGESPPRAAQISPGATSERRVPDIYYVILDAYGSEETLRDLYGYDNGPFLAALRGKGFLIVEDSVSNYAFTRLSLASSLNLRYIHDELVAERDDARRWRGVARLLKRNAVMSILRQHGYRYIHVRSGNDVTDTNPYADANIGCGRVDEFWSVAVQATILRAFDLGPSRLAADGRQRILCQFETLHVLAREKSPKFVFVHIVLPHPPFLFDAEGRARPQPALALSGDAAWRDRSLYRDQVVFASRRVLEAVAALQAASSSPPVIIIQGDHGPASLGWERLDRAVARERMKILNALYLPGVDPGAVSAGMSPVNTFRLVFRHYLGTPTTPLDDRALFSVPDRAYDFVDVTRWVK